MEVASSSSSAPLYISSGDPKAAGSRENLKGSASADESSAEYDELGFAKAAIAMDRDLDPDLPAKTSAYARAFEPKAQRRLQRFQEQRRKLTEPGHWLTCRPQYLKQLLRKGIPRELRGEVWWSILGCEARRKRCPDAYVRYLTEHLDPKASDEIDKDLMRTFPNHVKFRSPEGRRELRNILRAFARHSPEIRYCQGLNFISAVLLIVLKDEERAFWALVCAMDSLGVQGYYVEGMTLLKADMQVLSSLLQRHCPRVSKQFNSFDQPIELLSICSEWFITWFAKCLPIPTLLRVWDALFFEGFKVMFRVSLGIFHRVEPVIVRQSFDELMENKRAWPREQVEHNELLKASFQMKSLKRRDLAAARSEALCFIKADDLRNIAVPH